MRPEAESQEWERGGGIMIIIYPRFLYRLVTKEENICLAVE
jgi:hypothetical protein